MDGLSVDEATKKLQGLKLNPELTAELLEAANNGKLLKGSADEIADGIKKVGKSSSYIDDLGLAFKGLWLSAKPILTAIATNPFTWAIVGGLALAGIVDYLTVSYDEANKALDESIKKYEESKNTLSSLNDELKTNQEREKELLELKEGGNISQAELDELDAIISRNEQLEIQIELEKELLALQNRDRIDDAKEAVYKKSHSVAQSVEFGDETGKNTFKQTVGIVTDAEAIDEDIKLIDEYKKKISSLEQDLSAAQVKVAERELLGKDASPLGNILANQDVKNIEKEIDRYQNSLETLYSDLKTRSENAQKQLEILKLDPSNNVEEIRVLEKSLGSLNKQIVTVKNEISNLTGETLKEFSKEEMISQLNNMSEGFEELDKIYSSIKDDDPFDFKLLDDKNFKETFGGLDGYADFFETITSNADDIDACQSAFNDLVTEWLHGSTVLEGVTKENSKLTASMLKQMGVVNAEEVVKEALEIKENFDNVTEAFNKTKLALVSMDNASEVVEQLDNLGIQNAQEIVDDVIDTKEAYDELRDSYKGTKIAKEELANTSLEDSTDKTISALTLEDGKLNETEANIVSLWMETQIANGNHLTTDGNIANLQAMCDALGITISRIGDYGRAIKTLRWMEENKDIIGQDSFDSLNRYIDSLESNISGQFRAGVGKKSNTTNIKYGGGSSSNKDSGSDKETEETFDWIQVKIERLEREISNLDKIVNATYKSWSERNNSLEQEISKVTDEIALQEDAYKKYMDLANAVGLDPKYQELVKAGTLDYSTIKDEKLAEKIKKYQEFYNLAIACEDKIIDLEGDLANLAKQRFDNISSEYDQKLSQIDHETAMIEARIDNVEARGHIVSAQHYENLKKLEEQNLSTLKAEREALQKALDQAVADGDIEVGSEAWYTMQEAINGVDKAIIESNTSLVELNKNIRDLEWENFDRARDMISQVTDEADFFIDLMSDKDLLDENGNMTDQGEATMGLHLTNMRVHESEAQTYADEIAEINKQLANDPYNVELLERKEALIQSHRDSIKAAQDERRAMIDLACEGYEKMLESLDELIEKRKEYLQLEKDTYDYQKTIDEQVSEVERLEKIVQALSGDTSEEGMLRLQQSNKELEEAREQLQETQYDKWMSDQQQMLDTMSEQAQEWVDERLSNEEQLLSDIATKTEQNTQTIKETLETEAASVGTFLSNTMTGIWSGDGSENSVVAELEKIEQFVAAMVEESDKETSEQPSSSDYGSGNSSGSGNSGSSGSSGSGSSGGDNSPSTSPSSSDNGSSDKSSSWGSWFIKKNYSVPDSQLDKEKSIVDRLKWKDFDAAFTARQKYYEAMGLGSASSYTGSSSQNTAMLKLMKENGFKTGGSIGSLIKTTGEDGIAFLKKGEYVLTETQLENLRNAISNLKPFMSTVQSMPKFENKGINNTISNNVEMNISMHGVQDVHGLVTELQKDNRFQRVIQQMTIGQVSGGNSLSKYKYK